jgi:hypothetical protein
MISETHPYAFQVQVGVNDITDGRLIRKLLVCFVYCKWYYSNLAISLRRPSWGEKRDTMHDGLFLVMIGVSELLLEDDDKAQRAKPKVMLFHGKAHL